MCFQPRTGLWDPVTWGSFAGANTALRPTANNGLGMLLATVLQSVNRAASPLVAPATCLSTCQTSLRSLQLEVVES
ncbi:hypothetical protein N656DRAFT_469912 [Canariomyces notabilis]|uniref:Uncharacterized protein n=1 Tax=Canariomyces notabilis TaxID=2074819 RepID=A0AAN6QGA0_9PEZI|nr:hypothetical protein N656DRAFT_469912 [Canariomyces arenarius]